jgi:hypothetical protein
MATTSQTFFEDYASALGSYSADKISDFYQTPLAIYSDNGTQLVDDQSDVVAFWKEGVKPYKKMNIEKATPKVLSEEKLSEKISIAKVSWKNTDAAGKGVAKETNVYILSRGKNGPKISGLIIMAK